jgi:hypothetical protein
MNRGALSAEDESLVANLRSALARIAAAVGTAPSPQAVCLVLDGAELLIRGELMRGRKGEILSLLPNFVFLVTVQAVDHDRAIEISDRTTELIEVSLG